MLVLDQQAKAHKEYAFYPMGLLSGFDYVKIMSPFIYIHTHTYLFVKKKKQLMQFLLNPLLDGKIS